MFAQPSVAKATPSKISLKPARAGVLQRKCACGGTPGATGECEACRKKRLQRKSPSLAHEHSEAPPIVHQVLRSPGQPLDRETRAFMETRLGNPRQSPAPSPSIRLNESINISPVNDPSEGEANAAAERAMRPLQGKMATPHWDFSRIRVHTDGPAAQSAREVNALAYTVGEHVVFGRNRFAPATQEGQRLLAHELAHAVQQQGSRLSRQVGDTKDRPKPPPGTLRPHIPSVPPPPRSTEVPAGVNSCYKGAVCEPPIKGSAWDFGAQAEKESTPRPKTPTPAKEVKKAAEDSSPGVLKEIFEVTVNPGLSSNVGGQVDNCKEFNVTASDPKASCMEVPADLEGQAGRFNQGKECLDLSRPDNDPMCPFMDRDFWKKDFVETMTHEAAHIKFRRNMPAGISSRTANEITLHELSEMYAQLSEFPVHYRSVVGYISGYKDPKQRDETLQTSINAWVKDRIERGGEGILGMMTKVRCINECDKVRALVVSLMDSVTAGWPDEMKNPLLQELSLHEKLDWPLPLPSLRPEPEHPKLPPLYQPRGTFIPEIEKTGEGMP